MKIIITGSSGLIGSALVPRLLAKNHSVTRFVRNETAAESASGTRAVAWDVERGKIKDEEVATHDAVIHLAGESVAEGRWNTEKKRRIRDSRVLGTRLIAEAIARVSTRPRALICASAIGFYGDRGDEVLDERSAPGSDFLASVCREWEAAADPARGVGVRTVHLRFGVVLSPEGGALAKMLTPFKLGAGGQVGDGKQYMSWLTLDDALGMIEFALENEAVTGAVNCVAPNPVTNAEFTETLGCVLSRPTFVSVPKFAARIAFGEMADALLLSSTRVLPERLKELGYEFKHTHLEKGLRDLLINGHRVV